MFYGAGNKILLNILLGKGKKAPKIQTMQTEMTDEERRTLEERALQEQRLRE